MNHTLVLKKNVYQQFWILSFVWSQQSSDGHYSSISKHKCVASSFSHSAIQPDPTGTAICKRNEWASGVQPQQTHFHHNCMTCDLWRFHISLQLSSIVLMNFDINQDILAWQHTDVQRCSTLDHTILFIAIFFY